MLQVARLAPNLLQEAAERVVEFLLEQIQEDGGAADRAGNSDLYYTVFCLEGLIALRHELPAERVRGYLESFGAGDSLDLVHTSCLARCWAALSSAATASADAHGVRIDADLAIAIARRIESFRSADGSFHPTRGTQSGTVYHAFLAFGALQDLGAAPERTDELARSVAALARDDGSFANEPGVPASSTPTTAAAVTLLRHLGAPVPAKTSDWLLARTMPDGGFAATDGAPIPDLLSTATALHALAGLKTTVTPIKEAALDFVDTLWTGRAFCGNWTDDELDSEYTYYALLSLGHLSLA